MSPRAIARIEPNESASETDDVARGVRRAIVKSVPAVP
jgi:hypothetical protein